MSTQIETGEREIVLLEDAHIRPMMGLNILEPLPSRAIPYAQVDPFILVHEGVVPITEERASLDTKHHHRGFDNLWYVIAGAASTGHSTGPGGAIESARLQRIAEELGATPAQIALAWLLQRSPVLLPIPGTSTVAHLEENFAGALIELTPNQVRQLDAAI